MYLYDSLQERAQQIVDEVNDANANRPRMSPERSVENLCGENYGIRGVLNMLRPTQPSGWMCLWCGHLKPEQVTNDEHCALCGADLHYGD